MAGLAHSFSALRHRNFRLLWAGQLVSTTGSMMQGAAMLWHVSLLVDPRWKGLALGAVGLSRVIPIVAVSLLSGVVADALDRRRLMLATQSAMTVLAGILAAVSLWGSITPWTLYLLSALSSAALAFDSPARQALIPALVPREDLPNAISLNTIMFQMASVLGPSLAGVALALLNPGWVYALNALSFLAVIAGLLLMHGVERPDGAAAGQVSLKAAGEGLRFVFGNPLIRSSMLLDFFATFFASATALLPIYCQDILRVGPHGYGWLYAAPAAGAVLASLAMAPLAQRIVRRGPVLLIAVILFGLATIGFGLSRLFWLSFLCLAFTGATDTVSVVLRNIIRQLHTPDHLRGRMTSVNMIFFMGGPQLGEMEAGALATWLGAVFSVVSGGVGCLLAVAGIAFTTPELVRYRSAPAPEAAGLHPTPSES